MAKRLSHDARTILVICFCIWTVTMVNLYTIGGGKNVSTTIGEGVHIDARSGDFEKHINPKIHESVNPRSEEPLIERIKKLEEGFKQLNNLVKSQANAYDIRARERRTLDKLGVQLPVVQLPDVKLPDVEVSEVLGLKEGVQNQKLIGDVETRFLLSDQQVKERIEKKGIVLNANAKDMKAEIERVYNELIKEMDVTPARLVARLNPEYCFLTADEDKMFSSCKPKMKWMQKNWNSHPCYASYGVDGSACSSRYYLSRVENHCPLIPAYMNMTYVEKPVEEEIIVEEEIKQETWDLKLDPLLQLLDGQKFIWMRTRISALWATWTAAKNSYYQQIKYKPEPKKIFVYLGLLSRRSGFNFDQTASKGGPLGELLQWSDILATLYCLGNKITVADELDKMHGIINSKYGDSPCPKKQVTKHFNRFDFIYTDIVGLKHMRQHIEYSIYSTLKCKLRIVDSFGTEPAFNHRVYAEKHNLGQEWGGHDLNPQQFYTMFPHSPDNSFMGFAIMQPPPVNMALKKPQAVVYGKAEFMWQDKEKYLEVISKFVDVHATVFEQEDSNVKLPKFVKNHGILTTDRLHNLLKESMFFIGLGFPYEGPAPLEAIAFGCVFINPILNPPHDSLNAKFLLGKPTLRKLKSQHPYADQFIGSPNVKTVDTGDMNAVREAVKSSIVAIEAGKVKPKLNLEFTALGMLERLNEYSKNQDFCGKTHIWPPAESVSFLLSETNQSCSDTCWNKGLICEPSHFALVNNEKTISKLKHCENPQSDDRLVNPSFWSGKCRLQSDSLLYSCVGEEPGSIRICPCRDFIQGQVALCKKCR